MSKKSLRCPGLKTAREAAKQDVCQLSNISDHCRTSAIKTTNRMHTVAEAQRSLYCRTSAIKTTNRIHFHCRTSAIKTQSRLFASQFRFLEISEQANQNQITLYFTFLFSTIASSALLGTKPGYAQEEDDNVRPSWSPSSSLEPSVSLVPSGTSFPSVDPSLEPSTSLESGVQPSEAPSKTPSVAPRHQPSGAPSQAPSV